MHLLADADAGPQCCPDFFLYGGALLIPQSPASPRRARNPMHSYHATPMNFADATLVVPADGIGIDLVFTPDRQGFETYRADRHEPFTFPDSPSLQPGSTH